MSANEEANVQKPPEGEAASSEPGLTPEITAVVGPNTEAVSGNRIINTIAYVLATLAIVAELAVVLINVIARNFFGFTLLWQSEVDEFLILIVVFIGGAVSFEEGFHVSVTIIRDRLPKRWGAVLTASANWIIIGAAIVLTYYAASMVLTGVSGEVTPILGFPVGIQLSPVPVGSVLFIYYVARRLFRIELRAVALGLVLPAALFLLTWLVLSGSVPSPAQYWVLVPVAAIALLSGVPIAFILFGLGFIYAFTSGTPIATVPEQMADASTNFILLAIPFFVLSGLIMAYGGLGKRITDIFEVLVGRLRGGQLQVVVVAMYAFSGLSGSKSADMAAIGTTVGESAVESGYSRPLVAATLGASAIMGETVPPSIPMLIVASVSTISVASLFLAGIIPAVVLAVVLMVVIYLRAGRRAKGEATGSRLTLRRLLRIAGRSVAALLLPVLIVYGIESGLGTPTEISSFGVVYALIVSALICRELTVSALKKAVKHTVGMTGMILFIVSSAGAFSWFLALIGLPQGLANFVSSFHNRILFFAASIVIMMIMGAVLEGLPALIIMAPILIPIAQGLGIPPLQYAIIVILAHGLGAFMPPIGIGLYTATIVAKAKFESVFRPMVFYLGILTLGIALIAAVPWFSTWLPSVV